MSTRIIYRFPTKKWDDPSKAWDADDELTLVCPTDDPVRIELRIGPAEGPEGKGSRTTRIDPRMARLIGDALTALAHHRSKPRRR